MLFIGNLVMFIGNLGDVWRASVSVVMLFCNVSVVLFIGNLVMWRASHLCRHVVYW